MRAAAIAAYDHDARSRIDYYESLLADVPDPVDRDRRVPRQILAFDPQRESFIELSGDLTRAHALAVLGARAQHHLRGRRRRCRDGAAFRRRING